MRRRAESDSFTNNVRYALLALFFCVVNAVELVHAKFALLTLSELHAYWLGRGGHFPFSILQWSEQHFGGDALAMRLPLLAVFAMMLAVALLGLDRMVLRKLSPMALTVVVTISLFVLGVEQLFALRALRHERRAFFALCDRVERATAPGEEVVAGENLLLPLYTYAPADLRQELRRELSSNNEATPYIPATRAATRSAEIIFLGSKDELFAQKLRAGGYSFREYQPARPEESELVAHYYRTAGAGIYFVSPPAKDAAAAVSSKP
jgi:hypothetical protein